MKIDLSIEELGFLSSVLDLVKHKKLLGHFACSDEALLHNVICKIDDILAT